MNKIFFILTLFFISCNNTVPTPPTTKDTAFKRDTVTTAIFVNNPALNGTMISGGPILRDTNLKVITVPMKFFIDTSWVTALRVEFSNANKTQPLIDDTSWKAIQRNLIAQNLILTNQIFILQNNISALPRDDTSWKQSIQLVQNQIKNISPNDTSWKKMFSDLQFKLNNLPTDDTSWKYKLRNLFPDDTTWKMSIRNIDAGLVGLQSKISGIKDDTTWKPKLVYLQNKINSIPADDTTWKPTLIVIKKRLDNIPPLDSIFFRNGLELVVDPITKKKYAQIKK